MLPFLFSSELYPPPPRPSDCDPDPGVVQPIYIVLYVRARAHSLSRVKVVVDNDNVSYFSAHPTYQPRPAALRNPEPYRVKRQVPERTSRRSHGLPWLLRVHRSNETSAVSARGRDGRLEK